MFSIFNFEVRQISHITFLVGTVEYCEKGSIQKLSKLKNKRGTRFFIEYIVQYRSGVEKNSHQKFICRNVLTKPCMITY